ncbi:DUF421 domain-containing protein [Mesobacillus maritimus]|uniref:DUF421 domain-containing protein n=1 Tax=Mesobacillus maritimus TaxID=1643336 RepID=UPI00203D68FD|nr:DUF421 domain-containing protein [Mesobacillus maritimus]MCM3587843.1 DUF421 domain-containing protein [Mesobacillus maritimus]MCM3671772.1 DUF421 domain-containing protein [Mesobacillus maritimus]
MTFILKILVLYLATIVIMRLMGKSTIIQMTPYDLVAIIIVGTVAAEPLISTEFYPSISTLGVLIIFHILFSKATLWQWGNRFFLGEPTILIKHGEIVEDNMEKSRLSYAQLLSILRSKGYPKLSDIEYALLEPIGEVSVIPKAENTPVTVQHLQIPIKDEGLPIAVLVDGRIQHRNLKLLGKSKEWLMEHLANQDVKVKDILLAYVDEKTLKINIHQRDVE